jgi:elongation factor G
MGMNPNADGDTVVEAEVPVAEMSTYAIDLRAMTQARGSFTLEFARYEEVPKQNQAKIIEEAKANEE